jgi:hypothetical protein
MAVKQAVYLWNHMPAELTGISPHNLFSCSRWAKSKFQDIHVWDCSVYVLDRRLSHGNKLPRWSAHSQQCVYVSLNDKHATSVPLVLNLETGSITPQFHVIFDEWFATVASDPQSSPPSIRPLGT